MKSLLCLYVVILFYSGVLSSTGIREDVDRIGIKAFGKVSELKTTCTDKSIQISVATRHPFEGTLYAGVDTYKGGRCKLNGQGFTEHDFTVPVNQCGITVEKEDETAITYGVIVQVQFNPVIQQLTDEILYSECSVPKKQSANKFKLHDNTWMEVNKFSHEFPSQGKPVNGAVMLGQKLLLTVKSPKKLTQKDNGNREIIVDNKVVSCRVHDDTEENGVLVIDETGCPTDGQIFSAFNISESDDLPYRTHTSTFRAFKFPDKRQLFFSCKVVYCRGDCQQVDCTVARGLVYNAYTSSNDIGQGYVYSYAPKTKYAALRARRALGNIYYDDIPEYGRTPANIIENKDVVNSVNVVTDPHELALVGNDVYAEESNDLFCVNKFTFWWIVAILLLVLIIAVIVSLLFWLNRRRRRSRKESPYYYSSDSGATPTSSYPYPYHGGGSTPNHNTDTNSNTYSPYQINSRHTPTRHVK